MLKRRNKQHDVIKHGKFYGKKLSFYKVLPCTKQIFKFLEKILRKLTTENVYAATNWTTQLRPK